MAGYSHEQDILNIRGKTVSKIKISTKRTNKNQSKVKRALNWFKPTTPLKGMLLFALVFAIGGGSYYVSKSHAATATYTETATQLTLSNGASLVKETKGSKSSTTVVNIVDDGARSTQVMFTNQAMVINLQKLLNGHMARVCANVRVLTNGAWVQIGSIALMNPQPGQQINGIWYSQWTTASNTYSYICTPYGMIDITKGGFLPEVRTSYSALHLSFMTVEILN